MSAIANTAIGSTMPYITVFNRQVNKGLNSYLFLILNTRLNAQAGTMLITLRLNRTEISDIISTFQRYEYTIRFFIGEEQYANELRANYNNLIHYLKI